MRWQESSSDTRGTRDFRLGENAEAVTLGVEATADISFRLPRDRKRRSYRENVSAVVSNKPLGASPTRFERFRHVRTFARPLVSRLSN